MQYSIDKKDLTSETIRTMLSRVSDEVRANGQEAIKILSTNRAILTKKNGFYFDHTGSLIISESGYIDNVAEFARIDDRIFPLSDSRIDLRGPNYLVALNANYTIRDKLKILYNDYCDASSLLSNKFDSLNTIERLFLLDYCKNSAITIFNALIDIEKTTNIDLNAKYIVLRNALQGVIISTVSGYYYTAMNINITTILIESIKASQDLVNEAVGELLNLHSENKLSARILTRGESTHPKVILGTTLLLNKRHPHGFDYIVSMPAGSTELGAAASCFLCRTMPPNRSLLLLPISRHTQKAQFVSQHVDFRALLTALTTNAESYADKRILVLDDNSSTGLTIEIANEILTEHFDHPTIVGAVGEADIIRTQIDVGLSERSHVAHPRLYSYSVGILPVSKKIMRKHDLKEVIERKKLFRFYSKKSDDERHHVARICYEVAAFNTITIPWKENESRGDADIVRMFAGTFLSNFAWAPVVYQGKTYRSVERAYQRAKFKVKEFSDIDEETKVLISEFMESRGFKFNELDIDALFIGEVAGSSEVKSCADILVRKGYERADWNEVRFPIMVYLLLQKFRNEEYKRKLLNTGDKYLLEGNNWDDTYWGFSDNRGQNMLGSTLMIIRDNLRDGRI